MFNSTSPSAPKADPSQYAHGAHPANRSRPSSDQSENSAIGIVVTEVRTANASRFDFKSSVDRRSEHQENRRNQSGAPQCTTTQTTVTEHSSRVESFRQRSSTMESRTINVGGADPEIIEIVPSADEAASGAATLHSATGRDGAQSHRSVNQVEFIERQIKKHDYDIAKTLEMILSAIPKDAGSPAQSEIHELAERQAVILKKHNVTTPEELCDLLRQVKNVDRTTAGVHGFANGVGFNGASAFLNFFGNAAIAEQVDMENTSTCQQAAVQGVIAGLVLSAASVAIGPAVKKTFEDAYYLRPPREKLPAWVDEAQIANTPGKLEAGHAMGLNFVKTYGVRNLLRYITSAITTGSGGTPEQVAAIDNMLDPVGGCFAGMAFNVMHNEAEQTKGVGGLPYFLARDDFEACLTALNATKMQKAKNICLRAVKHVANSITTFPKGLYNNVATWEGWISSASLASGFSGVSAVTAAVKEATHGSQSLSDLAKYGAMMGLYYGYGMGMAAAANLDAEHATDPQSKETQSNDAQNIPMQEISNRQGKSSWRRSNAVYQTPDSD